MNERIKELLVKSNNALTRDGKIYPHIGSRTIEDWERFAELIVKECAVMTRNLSPHGELAEKAVKEHFGVKV